MKKLSSFLMLFLFMITLIGCSKEDNRSTLVKTVADIEKINHIEVSETNEQLGNILLNLQSDTEKRIPIVSKEQKNSESLFTLLGLEYSNVSDYAIITSADDTEPYTTMIVVPTPGYEEVVISCLFDRIMHLKDVFQSYSSESIICNNAKFEQYGDYFIVVITKDSEKDYATITEELLKVMGTQQEDKKTK